MAGDLRCLVAVYSPIIPKVFLSYWAKDWSLKAVLLEMIPTVSCAMLADSSAHPIYGVENLLSELIVQDLHKSYLPALA